MVKSKRVIRNLMIIVAISVIIGTLFCFTTMAAYHKENDVVGDMYAGPRGGYIEDKTVFTAEEVSPPEGDYMFGFYITNVKNGMTMIEDCSVRLTIDIDPEVRKYIDGDIYVLTRKGDIWIKNMAKPTTGISQFYYEDQNKFSKSQGSVGYYKVTFKLNAGMTENDPKKLFTVKYSKEKAVDEILYSNRISPVNPGVGQKLLINFDEISKQANGQPVQIDAEYHDNAFFSIYAVTSSGQYEGYGAVIEIRKNGNTVVWTIRMVRMRDGVSDNTILSSGQRIQIKVPRNLPENITHSLTVRG